MKTIILTLITIAAIGAGCNNDNYKIQRGVHGGQIGTWIWSPNEQILWSKYRPIGTSKDTLKKDSLEALDVLQQIKSIEYTNPPQ